MTNPGFQTVPEFIQDDQEHRRKLARAVNQTLGGKLNATLDVTLNANSATTTITDARLSHYSFVGYSPLTAHAAAEIGNGTMYIPTATMLSGSCVVQHANNSQTDRTFKFLVIG